MITSDDSLATPPYKTLKARIILNSTHVPDEWRSGVDTCKKLQSRLCYPEGTASRVGAATLTEQ